MVILALSALDMWVLKLDWTLVQVLFQVLSQVLLVLFCYWIYRRVDSVMSKMDHLIGHEDLNLVET